MKVIKRIYKNIVFLSTAEVISKILQFILMVYAAQLLDKSSFGKFSFALSFSLIGAVILADLGINTLLIREIARYKKFVTKYFVNAFVAKFVLTILSLLFLGLFLYFKEYIGDTKSLILILWIFTLISTFTDLFYSIFRAFERMHFDAVIKIVRMIILTILGLYVLFEYQNVIIFSITFIITELIMLVLSFFIALKRFLRVKFLKILSYYDFNFIKELLKKSFPFGLSLVFSTIYFYISSVMLFMMKSDVDVAIFSVAYNIALAILVIPMVYTNAIYPVMSRYYKTSINNVILIYKKSFKYLYIIGLPISVGLYLLANRVIFLFYGSKYATSIIVIKIISWYIIIKFLNSLFGYILSSIDKQNYRMLSQGFTAVFIVIANIILIPKIGYVGAALSTLITETVLFILYYTYVSKFLYTYNFLNILIKPLIAASIMAIFIKYMNLGLILLIPSSAIVYFITLLILRTFESDDYKIIKKIFKTN